jgi:replicative DNA helicase
MAPFADIPFEQEMPAAVAAERTILGAILLDPDAFYEASAKLRADDFSLDSHRRIYAALAEQIETTQSTDVIRLGLLLQNKKELDAVGGNGYLWSLTEGLPRRISIEQYVVIVRDKSLLRGLINAANDAMARAGDQSENAQDVLDAVQQRFMELSERSMAEGFGDVHQIVLNSFGSIDALVSEGREVRGLRTYYTEFDKMTSGLQRGELIVLAARPSMGKTALAINIAENVAIEGQGTVGIFSLEMSKESLVRRLLSAQSGVSLRELNGNHPGKHKFDKLVAGLDRLTNSHIYIDDTPGISLSEMRAKARRLKQEAKGLDLLVVDYLQLMSASPENGKRGYENRTQEVSAISRGLKILAKQLHVPVLALSQLSRASETRGGDKRPFLSDLRESGSIEQDADVVAFIHRQEYYERDDNPATKGEAEIIIAKQRNGPTGTVKLAYLSQITRFENAAPNGYADIAMR